MTTYKKPIVATKEDITKQIEIEASCLIYLEYMKKEEAFKKATTYIEEKYKEVIQELRSNGQYI